MKRKIYLLALISLLANFGFAQTKKCGTGSLEFDPQSHTPEYKASREAMLKKYQKRLEYLAKNPSAAKAGQTYVIPVVMHIMHNYGSVFTDFQNNKQDYIDAINNMNLRYKNPDSLNLYPPFNQISHASTIEFRLATIDENGNCTEGFTLTQTEATNAASDNPNNIKSLIQWDPSMYLNIWVVKANAEAGVLAWSHTPASWLDGSEHDGIVCEYNQLNSLAHEAGHYLGLEHPWGNGNDAGKSENCNYDDGVKDTPNCLGSNGCRTSTPTCTDDPDPFYAIDGSTIIWSGSQIPDNGENIMEYNGHCTYENFTDGQIQLMYTYLDSSLIDRNNLWSESNLAATGTHDTSTTNPCAPIAEFKYDEDSICTGSKVTFESVTWNGTVDNYLWKYGDGDSSTSSDPSHVYNTEGVYTVSLTVSNAYGDYTETKSKVIEVISSTPKLTSPVFESFEYGNFPDIGVDSLDDQEWILVPAANNKTFSLDTSVSSHGNRSLSLNLKSIPSGYTFELISPTIDFSDLSDRTCTNLYFKYAYAPRSSGSADIMNVYYSIDCGKNWQSAFGKGGTTMSTTADGNPVSSGTWVPADNEWSEENVSLSTAQFSDHMLLKFTVTSGNGNYFYLDSINIGCKPVVEGISDNALQADMVIVPNPFSNDVNLSLNVLNNGKFNLQIIDPMGRLVYNKSNFYKKGNHVIELQDVFENQASGIYYIRLNSGNGSISRKVIKN